MRNFVLYYCVACIAIAGFASCSNCGQCHTEVMGVKSPSQKLCGDDLKRAQQMPGMICE